MDARTRGLEDVVIGTSQISRVDGTTGHLSYRGHDIAEIVETLGYEATAALLVDGLGPGEAPHAAPFAEELRRARSIPASVASALDGLVSAGAPMDTLRSGLSALSAAGGFDYPPTRAQGVRLVGAAPTILAHLDRRRRGLAPIAPRLDLGHVENFLYMLDGSVPDPARTWALESYFDLVADHGMNASTFVLRAVLSTQSDLISAATAAVGALKGPLHGGAPQRVLDMLDAAARAPTVEAWVEAALARHERLMGFGHRAYKVEDPRAELLRGIAARTAAPDRFRLALQLERSALAALRTAHPDQRLFTNVEFYAAVVLESVGLAREMFPPVFAVARTAGWAAHALEQTAQNRLMRPEVEYTGIRGARFPAGTPRRSVPPGPGR